MVGLRRSLLSRAWRSISLSLPPLNFITLHYAYFIGVCMLSSIIFWGASTPARSVTYTDSLFLVVSAMTLAGLNTINLSQLNTFQQFILFILILFGSAIFVSIAVIHVRKGAFERRFKNIVEDERQRRRDRSLSRRTLSFGKSQSRAIEVDGVVIRGRTIKSDKNSSPVLNEADIEGNANRPQVNGPITRIVSQNSRAEAEKPDPENVETDAPNAGPPLANSVSLTRRITFMSPNVPTQERQYGRLFAAQGVGARQNTLNHPAAPGRRVSTYDLPRIDDGNAGISSVNRNSAFLVGYVGRNSQFSSLTQAERDKLGGVEYRALTILSVIVPMYFILWQLLGCIGLGAYVAYNQADTALGNGENPWWVGAFNGVSAFNNSGMSLLDANMVAFQTADYMLITMGLMILAGNTAYPILLRLILWTILKLLPDNEIYHDYKTTLSFLLDHPRRCYTNLFPARHTWWLVGALVALNSIDWVAFEVLNIGNSTITSLDSGARALDGLFQALAVRSGGFYVVTIPNLRIGLLVVYVLMMYISVYPVVITMRNSNVYEERSLGIYADDRTQTKPSDEESEQKSNLFGKLKRQMTNKPVTGESRGYFVRQQLRGQLAHDIWWIVLAVLFITITETGQFENDPVNYSVFNVIFEVVSAYGCVGISIGLPGVAYSFCGGWHVLSKLILCAVMIRGRHRGLPVAIDRAVLLPGEHLAKAEEEDALIRAERAASRFE